MRTRIEYEGTQLAFIHLGTEESAARFLRRYRLEGLARVSDPEGKLYEAFGLVQGSVNQLLGPAVIARGFWSFLTHGAGRPQEDVRRMPGVFLVYKGVVLREFRPAHIGETPEYLALARCPTPDCLQPAK